MDKMKQLMGRINHWALLAWNWRNEPHDRSHGTGDARPRDNCFISWTSLQLGTHLFWLRHNWPHPTNLSIWLFPFVQNEFYNLFVVYVTPCILKHVYIQKKEICLLVRCPWYCSYIYCDSGAPRGGNEYIQWVIKTTNKLCVSARIVKICSLFRVMLSFVWV